mgnify:CR=1 FL=1
MNSETEKLKTSVGEMHKRRETMADGKRYIIYYTFGNDRDSESDSEQTTNPKSEIPNPYEVD